MAHRSDDEIIRTTHNTARFFVETRQLAWVMLIGTLLWGIYGYLAMPQRKDPDIPIRVAAALAVWPGASPDRIEQLVTRPIEERMAENSKVEKITSNSRTGVTLVIVQLVQNARDPAKEFDDIQLKLDDITLPDGASINFIKDFGDTAALLLTVASPRVSDVEVEVRARAVRQALERVRRPGAPGPRFALIYGLPLSVSPRLIASSFQRNAAVAAEGGVVSDVHFLEGPGFIGVEARSALSDTEILALGERITREYARASEFHPDSWPPFVVRDPAEVADKMRAGRGDKYSYRELDDYTELIKRTLQGVPLVSKVSVAGVLAERVNFEYSQERLASYGLRAGQLPDIMKARNITVPGGLIEVGDKNLRIDPSGEFKTEQEIRDMLVPVGGGGGVYLRDLGLVSRGYDLPARFLNYYTHRDQSGQWVRSRAVTLAVQMRSGEQIARFGEAVDGTLDDLRQRLPEDLVIARTSDQPLQVKENIGLFMSSLYEAIALVVLVSLIGFWEWRSALLMALAIPITLAMTFGMMHVLRIDLQQVSIASLIIALGLLVDDPVVAGDAIKREMGGGHPPLVASWLGPTKLATAILFATITNIVAYVPFLALTGDMGKFMYSLPVVIGASLVASRLVSMTFIPLLGYYLLKPKPEPTVEERRQKGFAAWYYRVGSRAIDHRWAVLAGSFGVLALGAVMMGRLPTEFMPKDLSYLSYVDVWLPEDAPFATTNAAAAEVEAIVREVAAEYGQEHPGDDGKPSDPLRSVTTFVGGGGPRFWFSVSPEQSQLNYAQLVIEVKDKHVTGHLVGPLQRAIDERVAGANVDVRQLETAGVGIPISLRVSGEDIPTLRRLAAELKGILRAVPSSARIRDDWGAESFSVRLQIDPDRANAVGITNLDVAAASVTGMNGFQVASLREGDKQIPVVARMRVEERARLADVQNLYVPSLQGTQKVPLGLVSTIAYDMQTEKLQRRNQFRTITVAGFPAQGHLASTTLAAALPEIRKLEARLPPGYRLEIGGEHEEQNKGFGELGIVMLTSAGLIFLALVVQFRHAVKPFIVFAAIPYGMVGAIAALWIMGTPFGFMGFLGVASLVGVIVSHVIVLFDFIEEAHERGEPLRDALLHAGILRLRPVLITVGATVIALFPLASHGGPLWEPLCYAQIGGLTAATVITLVLVPVIYSIFVYDLKLVKWEAPH